MPSPTLDQTLRSAEQAVAGVPAKPPTAHPSSFGPLHLPQPGELPSQILLGAVGLPPDLIDALLAHRTEDRFFARVYEFADRLRDRFPRLVREVAWALIRDCGEEASRIAAFLLDRGRLEAAGNIALLCDLAEEDPQALTPHLGPLLALVLERDLIDPAEGGHRLSDLLCLTTVPSGWLHEEVAPIWEGVSDPRVRELLCRLLVFHRELPLRSDSGEIEEQVHHQATSRRSYDYLARTDVGSWRILDLTRELQLNLSELPRYAPSNHLRRFLGRPVEMEGFLYEAPSGESRYLLQRVQRPTDLSAPAAAPAPKTKARSRRRQRKAR